MKSSNTKLELWSSDEVCELLEINLGCLYQRKKVRGITPFRKTGVSQHFYTREQIESLNTSTYPSNYAVDYLRVETTYYIYPSKLNYLEL
jgi:hypothetical protein